VNLKRKLGGRSMMNREIPLSSSAALFFINVLDVFLAGHYVRPATRFEVAAAIHAFCNLYGMFE